MKYVLAIIILSVLILVHEFGHYVIAKRNGILVKEFSLGIGPRIISKKIGETRYSWKAFPIGGSCIMLGGIDDPGEEDEDELSIEQLELREKLMEGRSFDDKSVWVRMAVLFAGPVFNFLLAFVLAMIVIGFVGVDPARVTEVSKGSSAYEAGLREGDIITNFNGNSISFGRELYQELYLNPIQNENDLIKVEYERDGQKYTTSYYADSYKKMALGISYYADDKEAAISQVVADSPMEKAGLQAGDVIVGINGKTISSGKELQESLSSTSLDEGCEITIDYMRGHSTYSVTVVPTVVTYYSTGFGYNLYREKTTPIGVIGNSFLELEYQVETVYRSLVMLFTGHISPTELSGPVGIVDIIGDTYDNSVEDGALMVFLNLSNITILLSANLGVMNLLPIPALDGGRLLFCFIEVFRRKPISKEKEGIVHFVGMMFLLALMVFIVVNDIKRW